MSKIKSSSTRLELEFRKYVWGLGLRGYRIKNKITGKPDLYFPKKKIAVFIDGCFWHKCPQDYIRPKTNKSFWDKKIEQNIRRDALVKIKLKQQGVKVVRFWEHEIRSNTVGCYSKLRKAMNSKYN